MQRLFQKKNKKTKTGFFLLALFFMALYFFIFAHPLPKETRINIKWLIDLDNPSPAVQTETASPEVQDVYPFSMGEEPGDNFGYFSGNGKLVLNKKIEEKENMPYRVALSSRGFIYYPTIHEDLIFYDTAGRQKKIYHNTGPGFPVLSKDGSRFFLVKSDLSGIKELGREGEVLWGSDVASWITTLSYNREYLLCGSGDGTVTIFDSGGTRVFSFSLPKSTIDCIYGTALGGTNSLFAGISGLDPQYLFSGEIKTGEKQIVDLLPLDSEFRREVRMEFSADGKLLFFEGRRAINVYNTNSRQISKIPLLGDVRELSYSGPINILAVVSGQNNVFEIILLKPAGAVFFKDYFSGQKTFLTTQGSRIFLAVDNKLFCLDVLEE